MNEMSAPSEKAALPHPLTPFEHHRSATLRRLCIAAALAVLAATAAGAARAADTETPAAAVRRALGAPQQPDATPMTQIWRDVELDAGLSDMDRDVAEVVGKLVSAEMLIEQGQWAKAASTFQDVLDRDGDIVVPIAPGRYAPAWRYCTARLLAPGPADKLAVYRELNGEPARMKLAEARAARSREALLDVARRYGATASGPEVLDTLVTLEMEGGQPSAAVRAGLRMLELAPDASASNLRLLARLILALAASGDDATLARLAAALREHMPAAGVESGGRTVGLGDLADSLLPADKVGMAGREKPTRAVRPGALLWRIDLSPSDEQIVRVTNRRPPKRRLPLARFQPVMQDGVLYCQTIEDLAAIGAFSGRVLWRVTTPFPYAQRLFSTGSGVFSPAVTDNAIFVSLPTSPNGQAFYGRIDALPVSPSQNVGSTLWSVSTMKEPTPGGQHLWQAATSFACPPALIGDTVCVVARYSTANNDSFLCGYDIADGHERWQTRIARGLWTIGTSQLPDGTPVASRGGVAYCCTDMGTVSAVDVADGSLIWATQYEHNGQAEYELTAIGGQSAVVAAPPNRPLIDGDTLFVLPTDASHLYALDLATGRIKWSRAVRGNDGAVYLYLLAARDGRVFLSGSAVACLDAGTGRTLWRSVLFDSFPAGRGIAAADFVMCPIEGSIAMVEIAAEGRLAQPVTWRDLRPLNCESGNLLLADDRLVITTDDSISVFAANDIEPILTARIAAEPGEPRHVMELAMLYSRTAQLREAAKSYEHALRLLGPGDRRAAEVRALLAGVCEDLARELEKKDEWAEAVKVLERSLALDTDNREQYVATAVRRAIALDKANEPDAALAVLHKLLSEYGDMQVTVPDGTLRRADGLTVRADLLIAASIADIIRSRGREVYEPYEKRAGQTVKKSADEADAFETLVRLYPNSRSLADLRLARAAEAAEKHRFAAAFGELMIARRLCPGYDDTALQKLRERFRSAAQATPEPAPPEKPTGRVLDVVWQTPLPLAQTVSESAAKPGNLSPALASDMIFVASGKSLQAYNFADGSLAWETGVGWLGAQFGPPRTSPAGMPRSAVAFSDVWPDQPVEKAGAKPGDILLSFDGHPTTSSETLIQLCGTTPPGTKVELVILRDGRRMTLPVVLGNRPVTKVGTHVIPAPSVHQYVRVAGVEGDEVIANVDLTLLWINKETGQLARRRIMEPLSPAGTASTRIIYGAVSTRGCPPVIGDGVIVAGTPTNRLMCFDVRGKPLWQVDLHGRLALKIVANGDKVAVLTGPDSPVNNVFTPRLFVFDALSGLSLFREEFNTPVRMADCDLLPLGPDQFLVRAGAGLTCIDAESGRKVWELAPGGPGIERLAQVELCGRSETGGPLAIFAVPDAKTIVAADPDTGGILWTKRPGGTVQRLICPEGLDRIFFLYEPGDGLFINCCTLIDGRQVWETRLGAGGRPQLGGDPAPFAAAAGGRLFLVQHQIRPGRGALSAAVSAIRISDGHLLRTAGLTAEERYNTIIPVFGGKIRGGVMGLIMRSGVIGLSTTGE